MAAKTVKKTTTAALRAIDLDLLAIPRDAVKISRTLRDGFTGDAYVEVTLTVGPGRDELLARVFNDEVEVFGGKSDAAVALTNAIIALYSDTHFTTVRDGDIIVVDTATGSDVRDAWNIRAARRSNWQFWGGRLLSATITRKDGLTVYNHEAISAIPAKVAVAA